MYNFLINVFREQAGRPKCPLDPYFIIPDKCKCVDFQILKLQELPDGIPQGEIPRHLLLYCDRYLCERVVPGNRVSILGIFCIKKVSKPTKVIRIFVKNLISSKFCCIARRKGESDYGCASSLYEGCWDPIGFGRIRND